MAIPLLLTVLAATEDVTQSCLLNKEQEIDENRTGQPISAAETCLNIIAKAVSCIVVLWLKK